MFKKLWLVTFLCLLVLVSIASFVTAVDAASYQNPTSQIEVDSTIVANDSSPPMVADKTLYDAKMANGSCSADDKCTMVLIRNTNQSAPVGPEDTIISNLPVTDDTTEGGRQNVNINQFETVFSGDSEVTHPAVLVCESLATYGYYTTPNFAKKNGQNIDVKHRSPLPEVVYLGDRSGPGDGEASFAIACDSFAFLPDIGDPVYQASWPEYQTRSVTPEVVYLGDRSGGGTGELQTRSVTPEVVYLGNQSPAGDSNYLPKLGNEFAVVCGEDGC